jgi:hypothetical protein
MGGGAGGGKSKSLKFAKNTMFLGPGKEVPRD